MDRWGGGERVDACTRERTRERTCVLRVHVGALALSWRMERLRVI